MKSGKIVSAITSIVTAGALLAGGTFALFVDQATMIGNTFSTGEVGLLIAQETPSVGNYEESISGFNVDELYPGYADDFIIWLKNDSETDYSLNLSALFDEIHTSGNADIANQLMVSFTCKSDADNNGSLETVHTTAGPLSVNAWATETSLNTTLGPDDGDSNGTGPDETHCTMHVELTDDLPGVDNDYAGSSVSFDAVFNGTQEL